MRELTKLAAASIVIKKAAPDWLNKFLGRPTASMIARNKALKFIVPLASLLGLGGLAYHNKEKLKPIYKDISGKVQDFIDREPEIQGFLDNASGRGAALMTDLENAARLSSNEFQELLHNLQRRG